VSVGKKDPLIGSYSDRSNHHKPLWIIPVKTSLKMMVNLQVGGEIPFPQKTLLPVLSPFRIVNAIMISLVCPSSWDISSFLTPICGLFTAPYLQAVEPHRWILLF
jgi:hypothetical protein